MATLAASPQVFASDDNDNNNPDRSGFLTGKVKNVFSDDETSGPGFHVGPLYPDVDVVSSGAGPGPTLHFWVPDISGSKFDVHASASYSVYRYQYYDAQIGFVPHEGRHRPRVQKSWNSIFPMADLEKTAGVPGFNLYVDARYRDYPREDFYGIGASSLLSRRADYRLKDERVEGVTRLQLGRLSVMGRAGLIRESIRPGLDPDFEDVDFVFGELSAPGLTPTIDFIHLSGGAWLDFRDEKDNPHRGASFGFVYSRFDDRDDRFDFDRFVADARQYLPLGTNRVVLAFHELAAADRPDAGSQVPFYLQHTLGGSRLARGYPVFRFRDERLLSLSGELRIEVHPKVELAAFYDGAKVFPHTTDFSFDDLRHTWGAGLRLKSTRKVRVRVDVGHSREGTEVHLKLGPVF